MTKLIHSTLNQITEPMFFAHQGAIDQLKVCSVDDLDIKTDDGFDILDYALRGASYYKNLFMGSERNMLSKYKKVIEYLGTKSYPLNGRIYGKTKLTKAIEDEEYDIAKMCLELGADPNKTNIDNETALILAARKCDKVPKEILDILIESGADVNLCDANHKISALHLAVMKNSVYWVSKLLNNGADANKPDKNNSTPLVFATSKLNRSQKKIKKECKECIIELLLSYGADPNILPFCRHFENMPLYNAVNAENYYIVNLLLEHRADYNFKDEDGESALELSYSIDNDVIRLLIEKKKAEDEKRQSDRLVQAMVDGEKVRNRVNNNN